MNKKGLKVVETERCMLFIIFNVYYSSPKVCLNKPVNLENEKWKDDNLFDSTNFQSGFKMVYAQITMVLLTHSYS